MFERPGEKADQGQKKQDLNQDKRGRFGARNFTQKIFQSPRGDYGQKYSVYFKTLRTSLTLGYRFQGKANIYTLSIPIWKKDGESYLIRRAHTH